VEPLFSLRRTLFHGVRRFCGTKTPLEFAILFMQELRANTYMLQRADIPQLSTNLTKSRPSTLAGHKTLISEIIRHIKKN
jgi:hypothetical protein